MVIVGRVIHSSLGPSEYIFKGLTSPVSQKISLGWNEPFKFSFEDCLATGINSTAHAKNCIFYGET
jgi:hypothetical protein